MNERDCVAFLHWALPRMGLRERGFRRVRGQVRKRLARRLTALDLADLDAYRERLQDDPAEWARLDAICAITISRFWRDARLWEALVPLLDGKRVWCAGCASGEEPYSVALAAPTARVVATDRDPAMIERARSGLYRSSSLRELPERYVNDSFRREGELYRIDEAIRERVDFRVQDIRREMPAGPFDLVFCRNLVFTYFDEATQRRLLEAIGERAGAVVVGRHERATGWEPWPGIRGIYRKHTFVW